MDEQRQSSAVFSLNELMDVERRRVSHERATAEAERRALADRERAERAQRAAEAAERAARDARERLEREARASALKSAEIERARVEAQARMQAELLEAEHTHRQRLAEITMTRSRNFHRGLSIASAGVALLSLAGALWLYVDKLDLERGYRDQLEATTARAARAERALDAEKSRSRAKPSSPSETAVLSGNEAPATTDDPAPVRVQPRAAPLTKPASKAHARCKNKNSGDPLDDCL